MLHLLLKFSYGTTCVLGYFDRINRVNSGVYIKLHRFQSLMSEQTVSGGKSDCSRVDLWSVWTLNLSSSAHIETVSVPSGRCPSAFSSECFCRAPRSSVKRRTKTSISVALANPQSQFAP